MCRANRTRHELSAWVTVVLLVANVGCAHTDAVSPKLPAIEPSIATTESLNDSTSTHFAAKITMTVTGAQSLDRTDVVRTVIYRIDRTFSFARGWTTSITFDSTAPFGRPTTGGPSTIDIGSSSTSSFAAQLYDRQGNALAAPTPVDLSSLTSGRSQFDSPNRSNIPAFPPRPPSASLSSTSSGISANIAAPNGPVRVPDQRAWMRNIVIAPQRRSAIRASIVAALGAPAGKVGSLDRFTLTRNGRLFEQLVDPLTNVVKEENIAENGVLQIHTQHRYLTLPNGTMVRVGTHTQLVNPANGQRSSIDITYSNITLDTLGGAE